MFAIFESITNWLWGLPLLITIIVTGLFLTIRSGFFQFRHFGHIVKNMFNKKSRDGGDVMENTFHRCIEYTLKRGLKSTK